MPSAKLLLLLFASAAASNGFEPDDGLALHIGDPRNPPPLPLPDKLLHPVFLAHLSARFSRDGPFYYRVERCQLPLDGPLGSGQIALSGDGKAATFVCYPALQGRWDTQPQVSVFAATCDSGPNATFALATFAIQPGETVYSAVTDNLTSLWVATSTGLYHQDVATGTRELILSTPVTALSLSVNPAFSEGRLFDGYAGTETDVLPRDVYPPSVRGFSSFLLATVPALGAVVALTAKNAVGGSGPTLFASLPRTPSELQATTFVSTGIASPSGGAPTLFGHSLAIYPRGPDVLQRGEVRSTGLYPVPAAPGYLFVATTADPSRLNVRVYATGENNALPSMQTLLVDSQDDIVSVAAATFRNPAAKVQFQTVAYRERTMEPMPVLAGFLSCTSTEIYRTTYLNAPALWGSLDRVHRIMGHIPIKQRGAGRFAGVSLAPYDTTAPPPEAPVPTAIPAPSASPTAALTATTTATLTPPAGEGVSPANDVTERQQRTASGQLFDATKGLLVGPPLSGLRDNFLEFLALRIGQNGTKHLYRTQDAVRPMFLDVWRREASGSLRLRASMALPSKSDPPMRACTGSFHTWGLQVSVVLSATTSDSNGLVLSCYDRDADSSNNITILRLDPQALSAGKTGVPQWMYDKQPPLPQGTIAVITGDGYVDTRTTVSSSPACAYSELTRVIRSTAGDHAFYASMMPVAGAPDGDAASRCGSRFVPFGNYNGTLDVELAASREDVSRLSDADDNRWNVEAVKAGLMGDGIERTIPFGGRMLILLFDRLLSWDEHTSDIYCVGYCGRNAGRDIIQPGRPALGGTLPVKRSERARANIDPVNFLVICIDTMFASNYAFTRYTGAISADRNAPASRGFYIGYRTDASELWNMTLVPGLNDNKPILSMLITDKREGNGWYALKSDWFPELFRDLSTLQTYWTSAYVLTGQTEDSPTAMKGNSLWLYRLPRRGQRKGEDEFSGPGSWQKVFEFPCCEETFTVSIDINTLDALLPSPSATPTASVTAAPSVTSTATPSATPPPFWAELRPVDPLSGQSQQAPSLSLPAVPTSRPAVSRALPPVAFDVYAKGCYSWDGKATLECSSSLSPMLVPSSSASPPAESAAGLLLYQSSTDVDCPTGTTGGGLTPVGARISVYVAPQDYPSGTIMQLLPGQLPLLYGGSPLKAQLICTLTARSPKFGMPGFSSAVAFPQTTLDYHPYAWPLWSDIVLFYPSVDLLVSSRYGLAREKAFGSASAAVAASDDPARLVTAIKDFLKRDVYPAVKLLKEAKVFAATLTSEARATLIAQGAMEEAVSGGYRATGQFNEDSQVYLNGVLLKTLWVRGFPVSDEVAESSAGSKPPSSNGTLLHFQVPPIACGSAAFQREFGACGYATFTVVQPPLTGAEDQSDASASSSSSYDTPQANGFRLSCPPACPGLTSSSEAPLVEATAISRASGLGAQASSPTTELAWQLLIARWPEARAVNSSAIGPLGRSGSIASMPVGTGSMGILPLLSFTGATLPTSGSATVAADGKAIPWNHLIPARQLDGGGTTAGLFLATACPGFTDFNVAEKPCENTTHPAFGNCAFGDGISRRCQKCPLNAVCPGGNRARPMASHWTESEGSGEIIPCAEPASKRCLGWSDELGAARCGPEYKQGSYGCLECAAGTYPKGNSGTSCEACPAGSPFVQIFLRFLAVVGAIIGISLVLYGVLYLLAKRLGSTLEGSAYRLVDLVLFMVLLMQLLAEVSSTAGPGLPPVVRGFYDFFSAFNLELVSIHQSCLVGVPPFLSDVFGLVAVLIMQAFFLYFCWKEMQATGLRWLEGVAFFTPSRVLRLIPCSSCFKENAGSASVSSSAAVAYAQSAMPVTTTGSGSSEAKGRMSGCWGIVSSTCLSRLGSQEKLSLYARLLCIGLAALYARTSRAVFNGINCFSASISVQRYANLDGVTAEMLKVATAQATASATAGGPNQSLNVEVSLLRLNPAFLCNHGSHSSVAGLSWAVLLFYVILFPIITLVIGGAARSKEQIGSQDAKPASQSSNTTTPDPKTEERQRGTIVRFLLQNTFRSSAFYFRQLELVLLLLLAVVAVFWKEAGSRGSLIGRAVVTCFLTGLALVLLLLVRPYLKEESWRLPIRSLSLVLACLVAVINSVHGVSQLEQSAGGAEAARMGEVVNGLSVFFVVLVVLYLMALSFFIGKSMIRGAKAEASLLEMKRRIRQKMQSAQKGAANTLRMLPNGRCEEIDDESGGFLTAQELPTVGRRYVQGTPQEGLSALGDRRLPGGAFLLANQALPAPGTRQDLSAGRIAVAPTGVTGSSGFRVGAGDKLRFGENAFDGVGPEFETANPISFVAAASLLTEASSTQPAAPDSLGGARSARIAAITAGGTRGVSSTSALPNLSAPPA